ncbi:MAG: T9SS type A sorting domain-containing protein, partial [Bacteroidota bacterium]
SPVDNPKGPVTGFIMPDGKPYRGMRGGNWYNGLVVSGVNDGHSRVSNRNPSYYRGPQDPNHPYYHLGFRVVRKYSSTTGVNDIETFQPESFQLSQNYPNPFNPTTVINYHVPSSELVTVKVFDALGREVTTLVSEVKDAGHYSVQWNASGFSSGIYFATMSAGKFTSIIKLVLIK